MILNFTSLINMAINFYTLPARSGGGMTNARQEKGKRKKCGSHSQ